ncbi:hypothetical protein HKD37_18G051400 [Glycine soja]
MEGRKKMGSSSSFTSELFGSNQFQKSSASGIFESMFPPPPKVLGRGSLCSEASGKSSSEGWNYKFDYISMGNHGETQNTAQKDMSSIYQEQRLQPCQLSSSIHYGGQDIYSCPKSTQDSGYNSLLHKKDGVEDDLGSNLWQGK